MKNGIAHRRATKETQQKVDSLVRAFCTAKGYTGDWSDERIAVECGCSVYTVGRTRREMFRSQIESPAPLLVQSVESRLMGLEARLEKLEAFRKEFE
jgi:hypothetical protein